MNGSGTAHFMSHLSFHTDHSSRDSSPQGRASPRESSPTLPYTALRLDNRMRCCCCNRILDCRHTPRCPRTCPKRGFPPRALKEMITKWRAFTSHIYGRWFESPNTAEIPPRSSSFHLDRARKTRDSSALYPAIHHASSPSV